MYKSSSANVLQQLEILPENDNISEGVFFSESFARFLESWDIRQVAIDLLQLSIR